MKKIFVLRAVFCLLFIVGTISAQDRAAVNFAGIWEMNAAASKFPERTRIEATKMIVGQTGDELMIEIVFKRGAATPAAAAARANVSGVSRNIGSNGGGIADAPSRLTYNLNGNTVIVEPENPAGEPSTVLTLDAYFEADGKLKLNKTVKVTAASGESVTKTSDLWELLPDGKTLKVSRRLTDARGEQTAEMYFIKTDAMSLSAGASPAGISGARSSSVTLAQVNGVGGVGGTTKAGSDKSLSGAVIEQKEIAGGVLNSKALQLPKPVYPPAARAVRARGAVNVRVTVNESGSVISAVAVSGHPLLRAAAVEAARGAKFAPVLVTGIPAKVGGTLVFNFAP